MTDDLDDLKRALDAGAPIPSAAVKAQALDAAMRAFDAEFENSSQGAVDQPRPTSERPKAGLFRGVKEMFATIPLRGALVGSTALAAVALVALLPVLREGPTGLPDLAVRREVDSDRAQLEKPQAIVVAPSAVTEDSAAGLSLDEAQNLAPQARSAVPQVMGKMAPPSPASEMYSDGASPMVLPAPMPEIVMQPEPNTEAFPDSDENPLKVTAEEPVSTFSVDVDTASYAIVRDSLMNGYLPQPDAVRVEEMVNYFPYAYPAPDGDVPFRATVRVGQTPWNAGTQLVQIGLQGAPVADRPPLNLVFLIDTSGSMSDPDKLPLLKQSFRLMLGQLQPQDQVAIVTYAGSAGQVLAPTFAENRAAILAALDRLDAGGSTAGQAGLQQAYAVAETMATEGEVSRVILATDGDFNVGIHDPDALKDYIATKRDSGVFLNVLGFGRGNLDDATMQALAQNGNGQAAYIDTLGEAQKVLVDQLQGALFPIAGDVKVQVEFNPALVAEYRLIGYETRALRREDFNNDRVDAGDISAGHQVTALYEVTPVGSDARLTDPLRYGAAELSGPADELGFLRLRYKVPGETTSQLIEAPIPAVATDLGQEARFAAAIAGFGQLLKGGAYLGDWGYDDAIALATEARGDDPFGYRQEAVKLMRLAQSLAQ
ncbi:VWA domain-containing protein [Mesobacterium sp. TK19101]|uniref:VWA domain-containing protein n=1 Tax=Mesobacterium hydrothermale TaxID=3111907 RepID=A0ABU6HIE7_9RHOB|nr:VWA domain-containing protein [Mesobacterium sp. TK19101]MEC3860915.1 VWA domain-containing protein [Mesobacterium sp. TK19101]